MIKAEKLTFGFQSAFLFQNISFSLEENRHCALIGSNGTGKTTLIEMILAQLVINLRYSLFAISLSQKLDTSFTTPHRVLASFGITDEIFAVAYAQEGRVKPWYMYGLLTANTEGLVIITAGEHGMYYGRKGQPMQHMPAFQVDVRSTLGAGDTYKAGCVYALLHGMSDEETVRFAAACSGVAISRFPLPLNPPTLEEVNALLNQDK